MADTCVSQWYVSCLGESRLDQSMLAAHRFPVYNRSAPWLAKAQQADTGARVQWWWPDFCCHTCGSQTKTGQTGQTALWKSMDGRLHGRQHSSMTWFEFVAALCWARASSMALTCECSGYGPRQTHGLCRYVLKNSLMLSHTSKMLCRRSLNWDQGGVSDPVNQMPNPTRQSNKLLGVEISQIVKLVNPSVDNVIWTVIIFGHVDSLYYLVIWDNLIYFSDSVTSLTQTVVV